MGSLSRNFGGWRTHVMMNASRMGTGGQMAVLMQQELESLSQGTQQVADSVGHLAWVQKQASQAQLDAQYRLARIQAETNEELTRLNTSANVQVQILSHVSSQLNDVTALLRSLNDTTLERHNAIKAESLLKEVLFQLSEMLDNMIFPKDSIALFLLCRTAIEELQRHGLGTQHLSDLADKRVFAGFTKNTRQIVSDTPEEAQADLLAFETWYKGYDDARCNPPIFVPADAPEWTDGTPPAPPQFRRRPTPELPKRMSASSRPRLPDDLPEKCVGRSGREEIYEERLQRGLNPDNDLPLAPDNVPDADQTDRRFPKVSTAETAGTLAVSMILPFLVPVVALNMYAESQRIKRAREYEAALREWSSKRIGDYRAYHAECERVSRENEQEERSFPSELNVFREQEALRRVAHEEACRKHLEIERKRRDAWHTEFEAFVALLPSQAERINAFLDEHPDVQQVYRKVNWAKDEQEIRQRAMPSAAGPLDWTPTEIEALGTAQFSAGVFNMQCPACKITVRSHDLLQHYQENH